jgi:hypothetical protein
MNFIMVIPLCVNWISNHLRPYARGGGGSGAHEMDMAL